MESDNQYSSGLNSNDISILKTLYTSPENPASFSSAKTLYFFGKKLIPHLTHDQVKNFLTLQNTYTSFKKANYKFPRRKVELGSELDFCWAIDLAFELGLSGNNSNFKYFLLAIDVSSKFVWTVPTKSKLASDIQSAFREIVAQNHGKAPR